LSYLENLYFSNLDFILKTARSWTFLSYKEQVQSLSFAPLPNPPLCKGRELIFPVSPQSIRGIKGFKKKIQPFLLL
jgi:hypothetical protein